MASSDRTLARAVHNKAALAESPSGPAPTEEDMTQSPTALAASGALRGEFPDLSAVEYMHRASGAQLLQLGLLQTPDHALAAVLE